MKLSEDIISERNQIMSGFCVPLQNTPLFATDRTDHRCQLEKVYKGMLREACVIDDCCRRFERTLRWN